MTGLDREGARKILLGWVPEAAQNVGVIRAAVEASIDQLDRLPFKPVLGKGPNVRVGFDHIHSGQSECGMAFHKGDWRSADWVWGACSRLVNHEGECNDDENHSAI